MVGKLPYQPAGRHRSGGHVFRGSVFVRKPETIDPKLLSQMPGAHETPGGVKIQVTAAPDGKLALVLPGQPAIPLTQLKGLTFRTPQFSDETLEFVVVEGRVTGLKQRAPSGEFTFPKK